MRKAEVIIGQLGARLFSCARAQSRRQTSRGRTPCEMKCTGVRCFVPERTAAAEVRAEEAEVVKVIAEVVEGGAEVSELRLKR